MDVAYSIHQVPIRLTHERWFHIVENHDEMAGHYDSVLSVVEEPDAVFRGHGSTLVAARRYGRRGYLAVIYKELSAQDGFVVTAYFTRKLPRKGKIWKRQ